MQRIEASSPDSKSVDLTELNIGLIKQLLPQAVTENQIDFDILRELLGTSVESSDERFGLTWHGKKKARRAALESSAGTLRPIKSSSDSRDWDSTGNIVIEGDNLEVLKLLQKSYDGAVKLIYIDPPYNTGNDFIYPDDFTESLTTYLQYTGQVDRQGKKFSTNPESSGRFHTRWLSMMYPRLALARNLLRQDGLIMISIDDNEVNNLRKLCDEIFGEDQFLGQIIIQSNKRGQTYKEIAKTHEYLVIYSKTDDVELNELEKSVEALPFTDSKGNFDLWELRNRNPKFGRFNRPNLFFPIYVDAKSLDENGYSKISLEQNSSNSFVKVLPLNSTGEEGCWRWGRDKIKASDLSSTSPVLVGKQKRDGMWNIYEKSRKSTTKVKSLWTDNEVISEQGTVEAGKLGMGTIFSHPKPLALVQRCVFLGSSDDDIVLDFFGGSGTTGQAVIAQNALDNGNRKYVLVQLPEPLDPESNNLKAASAFCDELGKPRNLAELMKERLRRGADATKKSNPGFSGDVGFRVFRLDSSNIQGWEIKNDDLPHSLLDSIQHVKNDRGQEDILFELLLKKGLPLTVDIEEREIAGKNVYSVGGGTLIICLADKIRKVDVEALCKGIVAWSDEMAPASGSQCIFLDSAFENDVAKTNLTSTLQQNGITSVSSL